MYELPKKSGNGMKKPTLREAKELGLLPSVTTFLQIIDKPELDLWKQEQAIHAALTLPRKDGEPEDDFARRVVEDAEAQSETAMKFGSDIHAAIDDYFMGNPIPELMQPWLKSFKEWADNEIEQVLASEEIVGIAMNGLAYAGRMDLLCRLKSYPGISLVDFKSQRIRKNDKGIKQPAWYKDWILQLCGYAATQTVHKIICEHLGVDYFNPKSEPKVNNLVSVIIDSSEPGPIFVKRWEESIDYWHAVRNAYDLWCFMKGYTPTVNSSQPNTKL